MKIKIAIILFLISFSIIGQVSIDTTLYYDSANIGSVKKITNKKVCAIVVFVSGEGNEWTLENKKKVLKRDKNAYEKLKKELQSYDVNLDIHFEIFNLEKDFKIDSFVDYKKQKSIPKNRLALRGKYNDANAGKIWDFYTNSEITFFKNKEYLNYDGGHFMIMYHEGLGWPTASPAYLINNKENFSNVIEHTTIFEFTFIGYKYKKQKPYYKKPKKFVTMHEMLHLFSAWDLYNAEGYGFVNEDYNFIKMEYPESIMRNSRQITIDPLTAWRIGINNNPEKWFLEKVPKAYHKNSYNEKGEFIKK